MTILEWFYPVVAVTCPGEHRHIHVALCSSMTDYWTSTVFLSDNWCHNGWNDV